MNAFARGPPMDIVELLAFAVHSKASDLHLSAGLPPIIRSHGELQRLEQPALSDEAVQRMIQAVMNSAQRAQFAEQLECDFSFEIPELSRFRVNAFQQRCGASAALRVIPSRVQSLQAIGAPKILAEIVMQRRGLILVTGPTGSGKSTTLAAMIDHLNENSSDHVLTIEDPIEFVHSSKRCLIQQREVGTNTRSFEAALRSALREDPDIVLVGEMRDLETIRLALTAAETGHLVFGTLHTASAAKTIDRIIDVFPAGEKEMVRTMLSESLRAVIAQVLLRNREGTGRVAAHEILVATPAIRNLIRESKVAQMFSTLQTGSASGMQTLDQCLSDLVRRGLVSMSEARLAATQKEGFGGGATVSGSAMGLGGFAREPA